MRATFYLIESQSPFDNLCVDVCEEQGLERQPLPWGATVAIAPCLTRKLPKHEWTAPRFGTLIFHPSILPYHRGPDAIRWAALKGERVSGVSWFWADDGLDTGAICEQEPVLLHPTESPGRAYHTRFIPAGLRALARAVSGIAQSCPRAILQDE